MKESNTLVNNVVFSQLQREILLGIKMQCKYPCSQCGHQLTSKVNLAENKRAVHEGVKYPWEQCGFQATVKESLALHKRAVHEGVKYPYEQCGY